VDYNQAWIDFTGKTWEQYVDPIKSYYDSGQTTVDRNDFIRDAFNALAGAEGNRDVAGIESFYTDPAGIFCKLLAWEAGSDDLLNKVRSGGAHRLIPGGPYRRGLDLAIERFGAENLHVFDHGCGTGDFSLGIAGICPNAKVHMYDYKVPTRQVLHRAILEDPYTANIVEPKWIGEYEFWKADPRYNLVITNEVLEHLIDPELELQHLCESMVPGGILYLSTFFNSCDGHDPQHLDEHAGFQDTVAWFKVVDKCGFDLLECDSNGCEKIFRKKDNLSNFEPRLQRINSDATISYESEGPGCGAGGLAIEYMEAHTLHSFEEGNSLLEIGFGSGDLLLHARSLGAEFSFGSDIAQAAIDNMQNISDVAVIETLRNLSPTDTYCSPKAEPICISLCDVSDEPLPIKDDTFDFAFCTEVIEHIANPLRMVAEVKRTLKHNGVFVLAFPMPESVYGYGNGVHSHVLGPGFLMRDSFECFMKQLFFKLDTRWENGGSVWYVFRNYKAEGVIDVFKVVSGNHDENVLFQPLEDF
jgi:2-polyprenyl-3-methyl-5-hydroxy-6-metoxy-1,4-benzoquinol methylase